jgi:ABC-type bacteriocin/lantibiotic exporter with double-glycine peptidase domain
MFSKLINAPVRIARQVLDPRVSPLRHLPKIQQFQVTLVLSLMWTAVFCSSFGAWLWYGELIVFHVLVASATLVTGVTFHKASRLGAVREQLMPAKADQHFR